MVNSSCISFLFFLFFSGVNNHPMFSLLSLLLIPTMGLIPTLRNEEDLNTLTSVEGSVLSYLPLSLLPSVSLNSVCCSYLNWFISIFAQLKIPSTTSWEFPLPYSCVFFPYFLGPRFSSFLILSIFWWNTFSSSFLRKVAWKYIS